ncbi:MAG: hypothetical protein H0T89_33635 [Deltaproteobacteria bacterium]|nr:hypothetical protein [Deltaproteobacteria bacterium]
MKNMILVAFVMAAALAGCSKKKADTTPMTTTTTTTTTETKPADPATPADGTADPCAGTTADPCAGK